MDDRTFHICRPSLDDPDRAKTQALCSDLAITAAAPSGCRGRNLAGAYSVSAIKSGHAANCLRLPPLTIVYYARPDKTKDQRLCTPDLPRATTHFSLLAVPAGSTERFFGLIPRELALP